MVTITTQRLILRQPKATDLRFFHECSSDPHVAPDVGWAVHTQMKESLTTLTDFVDNGNVWAIVDKLTNRMIGTIGLVDDPKRTNPKVKMLGYALGESYWGQGMATEAAKAVIEFGFEKQNLEMISIYHYTHNQRSKSVVAKCGFRYEGVLRKATPSATHEGYLDEACYSLTKQEYLKDKEPIF